MKITEAFTADRIKELLAMPKIHNGHHITGSSSLGRCVECSGSVLMNLAHIDTDTSNEDSDAGTKKHKAIEDSVVDALNSGKPPVGDDHVIAAYKAVSTAIDSLKEAGWTIKSVDSEKTLLPKGIGQGTIDVLITAEKEGKGKLGFSIDYKTGGGAAANDHIRWQLTDHARLLFDNGYDITYCNAYSTQNSEWLYADHFKWRKSAGDDVRISDAINAIIALCFDHSAPELTPSPDACRYCRGALSGKCPAYMKQNKDALITIMPNTDLSIFAAIELVKAGHAEPEIVAKIDAGKVLHKQAQDYLDGIKKELDGAIVSVGGTEKYGVQIVKESTSIDYKACWLRIKNEIPFSTVDMVIVNAIEDSNTKPRAGYTKVAPRTKKTAAESAVVSSPTTNTTAVEVVATVTPIEEHSTVPPVVPPVATVPTKPPRKPRADKGQKRGARTMPATTTTLDSGPIGEIQASLIGEIDAIILMKTDGTDLLPSDIYQTYREKYGKEMSQMTSDELRAMKAEVSKP